MSDKQGIPDPIGTDITADERAVRKAAFHTILDGEAIDRAGLVVATGLAPERVAALLDGLTERGLVVVEPESGRVVGSWGLSLVPTDHRLHIRDRALHTWCALDAVGIPAALGEDASIGSRCHQCGAPVSIEMVAGQVARAVPPDVRLWVAADQAGRSAVEFTWPLINFFCSVEHMEEWRQAHPEVSGKAATLSQAMEIGRRCWAAAR